MRFQEKEGEFSKGESGSGDTLIHTNFFVDPRHQVSFTTVGHPL